MKKNHIKNKGFSLIELMVSVSIFAIVGSVVLINNSNFNSGIILTNTAYRIAINIKEAQTYGVSVKSNNLQTNFSYDNPFGFYVSLQNKNQYLLFVDSNGNDFYNINIDTKLETSTINRGNKIKRFCVQNQIAGSFSEECFDENEELNIVFKRPKMNAKIFYTKNNNLFQANKAFLCIASPNNESGRVVSISSIGDIAVSNDNEMVSEYCNTNNQPSNT